MKLASLNVLPPEQRKALKQSLLALHLRSYMIVVVIFLIACGVLLQVAQWQLAQYAAKLRQTTSVYETQTIQEQGALPAETIRKLNATLSRVAAVQNLHVPWTAVTRDIVGSLPSQVTLTMLDINQDARNVLLRGQAATRGDLVTLHGQLQKNALLRNVSTPTSDLLIREDIPFEITAELHLE